MSDAAKMITVVLSYLVAAFAIYIFVGGYFYEHSDRSGQAFRSAQLISFIVMWIGAIPFGVLAGIWLDRSN